MGDALNLFIKVRNIFREIFDDDSLVISENMLKTEIEDWDSIAHVNLVLAIEEEFSIRFTTDEVASVKSVGDFMAVIKKHTSE
jgi:acyl carrier protein